MKRSFSLFYALLTVCLLSACSSINQFSEMGTQYAVSNGKLTQDQADSINRSTQAVTKTFEQITPEQEYYIGRSVTATILSRYTGYYVVDPTWYLNQLGQSLAQFSDRPETFMGYRFMILDTDEINAFAAPGGFVVITKGLIRCCRSEDELAAVLAHEISHVTLQHGLRAIKTSRLNAALTTLSLESAKQMGGAQLSEVTRAFEESITDISSTLMNNGYSRNLEFEADQSAIVILQRSGYAPQALLSMLESMNTRIRKGQGMASTHPAPQDRLARVQKNSISFSSSTIPAIRQERFMQFTRTLEKM